MKFPLVSILVPVYGVEIYIERCARSLFEQTYQNIEYIFVDDCSPDNSIDALKNILKEYPQKKTKVKIIKHDNNRGLAVARNTAIQAASGKYVLHVDSDDYLLDHKAVDILVKEAEENKYDIVFFDGNHCFADTLVPYSENIPLEKNQYLEKLLKRELFNTIWGQLIRTALYKDNNICCLDGVNYGEDFSVKPLLLYYCKKYTHLKKEFYAYNRVNDNSYTQKFSITGARQLLKAVSFLSYKFNCITSESYIINSLEYSTLRCKAESLNRWYVTGRCTDDFYEIKSYKAPTKYFMALPLKYKISLLLPYFFKPNRCQYLYMQLSKLI